jgi:hypothetical protein
VAFSAICRGQAQLWDRTRAPCGSINVCCPEGRCPVELRGVAPRFARAFLCPHLRRSDKNLTICARGRTFPRICGTPACNLPRFCRLPTSCVHHATYFVTQAQLGSLKCSSPKDGAPQAVPAVRRSLHTSRPCLSQSGALDDIINTQLQCLGAFHWDHTLGRRRCLGETQRTRCLANPPGRPPIMMNKQPTRGQSVAT